MKSFIALCSFSGPEIEMRVGEIRELDETAPLIQALVAVRYLQEYKASTGLPDVTSADAGKVLTVSAEGAWTAKDGPQGMPAVTSADAGKVAVVNSNGVWIADEIPSAESSSY